MDLHSVLLFIHILSAIVLFGVGLGTAFAMWLAHRSNKPAVVATVAGNAVIADWVFTTPAVIIQPLSGVLLMRTVGFEFSQGWIAAAIALYVLAGACWIPVVGMQIRARDMARAALEKNKPLPAEYHRIMRLWFRLGWPAFIAVIVIFWLMIAKPVLW